MDLTQLGLGSAIEKNEVDEQIFFYHNHRDAKLPSISSPDSYLHYSPYHKPCYQNWNRGEHGWIGNYTIY